MEPVLQLLVPTTGRFVWKEDTTGKGYLEWASNNPNADKLEKRRRAKEGNKRNDRIASSVARNHPSKNRGQRQNQPKSPRPPIKVTETHTTVTLDDIKAVAYEMLSDTEQLSETFEGMYSTVQFDNFLLHLLRYFHCFFEKLHQEHKQNISTYM